MGDALYTKVNDGRYIFNAQLLQEEIAVLKSLKASFLLVSHFDGLIRRKEDVIAELETIFKRREQHCPEIKIETAAE